MGRVNARKRKAKAKVVVAATEKAHGKTGKITLKIQQKGSKVLGDKEVDLREGSDDSGKQLRPDDEDQQNEELTELESEDDKFEDSEEKEEGEEEEREEGNEGDEIPALSLPPKTAIRVKKGGPPTKVTVKTTSSSRSTKQPNTKKPSSSSSSSIIRKPLPNTASKSTLKSRQRVIPIPSDSKEDIEEEEAHISDQEISNDEGEKVVKRGTKKGPPERDAEIDIFEFELYWRCHFEEKMWIRM